MKKIYCDVCGKVMDARMENAHYAGNGTNETGIYGLMVRERDVCPACMTAGRAMNMERVILDAWKERSAV